MKNNNEEQEVEHKDSGNNTKPVSPASYARAGVAGLLLGGLAGAGAALLLAPQSGKETRVQIQQKTIELRDRAAETADQAISQVKSTTHQITTDVREKAGELQQHGQELLVKQLEHVSAAAEAGKAAIKGS